MSKVKTTFFCQNCGTQYAKWQGQCNACKEWNTIAEEIVQKQEKVAWKSEPTAAGKVPKPLRINEIDSTLCCTLYYSNCDCPVLDLHLNLRGGLCRTVLRRLRLQR